MASDYFLNIDGIKGESQDSKHKDEIEVEAFSWGLSNHGSPVARGSGGGAGKVSFQDFHFTMKTNKASPSLFLACASGVHFKKAVLTVRKAGENPVEYYKIALNDLLVSSFSAAGDNTQPASETGDPTVPTEQFSLSFSRLEFSTVSQNPTGAGDAVVGSWDLTTNANG